MVKKSVFKSRSFLHVFYCMFFRYPILPFLRSKYGGGLEKFSEFVCKNWRTLLPLSYHMHVGGNPKQLFLLHAKDLDKKSHSWSAKKKMFLKILEASCKASNWERSGWTGRNSPKNCGFCKVVADAKNISMCLCVAKLQ